ncbi:hypothetical protein SIO70_01050 [Chitinophaga sancti]|uniref:hypothetical protein n=1 Tax=Chitinophaga sancti TaxID=1004 RepID=UPI002A747C0C|nr:hypothetical protein [Chitinophaga sancti]WPQ63450.1 hypothetical protein SIO70_01050 [Chitinophaga sancti]
MFNISISVPYCMLGALAVLILQFIDDSKLKLEDRPDYLSPLYYIRGILGLILAGILGYVYFQNVPLISNTSIYFHTGASTPLIIRTLQNTLPPTMKVKTKK